MSRTRWGVEKTETFEYLLEQALNQFEPTEILNLGVGNFNTSQSVNLFRPKGLKYRPDRVVLLYFLNDAEPTPSRARLSWLARSHLVTRTCSFPITFS